MSRILQEEVLPGERQLQIVEGDLTEEMVDAIVNAANAYLQHGGGVAGAISRRAGPQIQQESNQWVQTHGPVSHDKPAYTSAGKLPCRWIIHAVGPVWGEGDEDRKLGAAIYGSLAVAEGLGLQSISFPAISTGVFGFPKERAARIMLKAIRRYFERNPESNVRLIRLTLLDVLTIKAFQEVANEDHEQHHDHI